MKYLACTLALALAICAGSADAQTFTTLVEFTGTSGTAIGGGPRGSLTLVGTTLYGMTSGNNGVANSSPYGNIFSVGINGANYQNLLSFTGSGGVASGGEPYGSLTLSGTTLYGMTSVGGAKYLGNIFSVGSDGTNYHNLVSFTGTSGTAVGNYPYASLTLSGTNLYGMTYQGGGSNSFGSIFSVGSGGTGFTNLISFTTSSGSANGTWPFGSLTLGGTTLYGMTSSGGGQGNGHGNIFSVGADGKNYRSLVNFTGTSGTASGDSPDGSLTLSGTTLYGMTYDGGANAAGNIFSVGSDGTNYHNLVSFTGNSGTAIGNGPHGGLTLSGTTLYGMTEYGGVNHAGNIFSVGIDGLGFDDLYDFAGGTNGVGYPFGDLTLSGGTLFGMAAGGIATYSGNGNGTVFALTLPAQTPEPDTLVLLAAGTLSLLGYYWRRRRTARRTVQPERQADTPAILSLPSHASLPATTARRAA